MALDQNEKTARTTDGPAAWTVPEIIDISGTNRSTKFTVAGLTHFSYDVQVHTGVWSAGRLELRGYIAPGQYAVLATISAENIGTDIYIAPYVTVEFVVTTIEADVELRLTTHGYTRPFGARPESFDGYDSAGDTAIAGTAVTLPLGTTDTNTGSWFTLATNAVTPSVSGEYEIEAKITTGVLSGAGDNEVAGYIAKDATEITGTRAYNTH